MLALLFAQIPVPAEAPKLPAGITWRFDGAGRFPDVRPPTEWQRDRNILWKTPVEIGGYSSPIVVRDRVFVTEEMGSLVCLDVRDGKVLWSKPKVGKYHAALLRTGDDKLLMLSDLGDLVLFEPDPAGYKELARSKVVKGEAIWAHPALVDGKLYFRDEKELICLQMPE